MKVYELISKLIECKDLNAEVVMSGGDHEYYKIRRLAEVKALQIGGYDLYESYPGDEKHLKPDQELVNVVVVEM